MTPCVADRAGLPGRRSLTWLGAVLAALAGACPAAAAAPREYLPPALSWLRQVEAVQMLTAILDGTPPAGPGTAWFHPGRSRYGHRWLVGRMDRDGDGAVSRREFTGPAEWFDRLDRDHDGRLTPADFDWSDAAPVNRQMRTVNQLFARADADHDERLTAAEWQALFRRAAKGKDSLSREELHALLFPPPPPRTGGGMPSRRTLLKGLLDGEIGSWHEGPAVGRPAPDFTLRTHDDAKDVTLSRLGAGKPVVLVFGSFT